jgi:hypothetical protein
MAGEGSLSVKTALAARKVKGAWTLKRLLYLLDSLAKYDMNVEKKQKNYGWASTWFALASIASLVILAFLEFDILGYAAAFFALLFIVFLVLHNSYSKKDLSNDFREYLIPLLKLLSGDIEERSKIALNMDLGKLKDKKYSKGAKNLTPNTPYTKMTLEQFERPLVTMATRLRDGNRLLMERFESLTIVTKSKKNPRGKTKTKIKYKRTVSTRMKLVVNPRVYLVRKNIVRPAGAQVSAKAGAKRITIDMKLAEKGGLDVATKPDSTIKQIAFLYSCIAPSKRYGGDNRVP